MAGAAVSAVGSIYSGMAQAAGYEASAQGKLNEQASVIQQAGFEQDKMRKDAARLKGQQITATAASGVDIWGTPSEVVADSQVAATLDQGAVYHNARTRGDMLQYGAKIDKMNAKQARTGAVIGAIAPLINGFTGLKTSFA